MNVNKIPDPLSALLIHPKLAEQLFDHLPDIVFFIKDLKGRYLVVNQTLVERCGAKNKPQIIGLTPAAVLGEELGSRYVAQDQQIIENKQPLLQHLELHMQQSRELGWCLTTKIPLVDQSGQCTGLIGVSQDLKLPEANSEMFANIHTAVKYAEDHIENNPSIVEMATMAKMSHYQLDRRMKLVFGLTAGKWLIKTKISMASHQLLTSDLSVLEIALSVGYSDQSAFTKQFKKVTGMSPLQFKKYTKGKTIPTTHSQTTSHRKTT